MNDGPQVVWLDTAEVAFILCIERQSVWRYITSGRLVPDRYYGRSPVFRVSTIRNYIEALPPGAAAAFRRRKAKRDAEGVREAILLRGRSIE